jgi:hypothetical protein
MPFGPEGHSALTKVLGAMPSGRRAGRWFRLDRIAAARLTTEPVVARRLSDVFGDPPSDAVPVSLLP